MKAVAPTTFARMSESLMSRKPLHKRLSRGFATRRSLPPIVEKNWRQKLPGGSPQGCEMPVTVQLRRVVAAFRPTGQDVVAVGVENARPSASWFGLWAFRGIEVLAHGPAIDAQTVSHCPDGLCLCIEAVDLVIEGLPPLLPLPPLGVLAGFALFGLRRQGSFRCRLRLLN